MFLACYSDAVSVHLLRNKFSSVLLVAADASSAIAFRMRATIQSNSNANISIFGKSLYESLHSE